MSKKTGGAAFPHGVTVVGKSVNDASQGMALRDYFAAAALQGLLANSYAAERMEVLPMSGDEVGKFIVKSAYAYADCMLEEGGKS